MEWNDEVRKSWCSSAPSVQISFPATGVVLYATPKLFSSQSVGWFLSQKLEVEGVRCQITASITAIGSRPTTTGQSTPASLPNEGQMVDASLAEFRRQTGQDNSGETTPEVPQRAKTHRKRKVDPGAS